MTWPKVGPGPEEGCCDHDNRLPLKLIYDKFSDHQILTYLATLLHVAVTNTAGDGRRVISVTLPALRLARSLNLGTVRSAVCCTSALLHYL